MLDLRDKLRDTRSNLETALEWAKGDGRRLGLLFYHTHPNYGESHIYIKEDESQSPEDEVLGQTIDYHISYDGWTDATTWWEGEPPSGEIDLVLLDGSEISTKTNSEFNRIWASEVTKIVRETLEAVDPSLVPIRVVVGGENGESTADWRPAPRS